jgi:Na+-transporting methylmalonyl-CoA/oxaloacetate decarboxylase gamma subunit
MKRTLIVFAIISILAFTTWFIKDFISSTRENVEVKGINNNAVDQSKIRTAGYQNETDRLKK